MYIFGIKHMTAEDVEREIDRLRISIRKIADGSNSSWAVVRHSPSGEVEVYQVLTEQESSEGIKHWIATDEKLDVTMEFVIEGDDIVKILSVCAGGRHYKADKYLKGYANWAVLFAGLIKYGKLPQRKGE